LEGILFDWTLILHGTTSDPYAPVPGISRPTRKPRPSKPLTGKMPTSDIANRKGIESKVAGKRFFIGHARVLMFVCYLASLFVYMKGSIAMQHSGTDYKY